MNKAIEEHKPRNTPSEFDALKGLIKQTGLTSRELAPLFKVSNTTVLKWADGAEPVQEVIRLYAIRVIKVLQRMVEAKELPLGDMPHKDRMGALMGLWKKRLAEEARSASPKRQP